MARVPGTAGGRSVAIVGHIDEIGLIVHHIDDDGFLWFTGVGGWDPIILVGQRVSIATRAGAIPGVVGKKPIHLMKEDDRKRVPQLKDLHIDIGAKDGDEARRLVRVGDVAVIDAEPVELPNDRFISRSMDNRIGCYVALEAARLVAEAGGAPGDVYALAVTQEEITFGGARTTAFSLNPDVAIAVDVTFATDQPGISEQEVGRHRFGTGPVLTRGSTLDPTVFELLHETARGREHPVHRDRLRARHRAPTPTPSTSRAPASRARSSRCPLRYMHSPVEMVQLDDIANAAKLIAAFAQRLAPDTDFKR